MSQQYIVGEYIFDPVAKTIALPSVPNLRIEGIQLITNLTTGALIYQFNNLSLGGTVANNVLTLLGSTAGMASTDKLQILYNPPSGGFFDRVLSLLYQGVEYLRAPAFMVQTGSGPYMRVLLDLNSSMTSMNTLTTVNAVSNVTNFNNIDTREMIWSQWDTEYNTGIRSKIV